MPSVRERDWIAQVSAAQTGRRRTCNAYKPMKFLCADPVRLSFGSIGPYEVM